MGAFAIFDFNRPRRSTPDAAVPIAAAIFLDLFKIFLIGTALRRPARVRTAVVP